MKTIMIKTHEVWLETLMAGCMSQTNNKQILFEFADTLFRHFSWLEDELIELSESYTHDHDPIAIKVTRLRELLHDIINRLNEIDLQLLSSPDKELDSRIAGDIHYMREVLLHMNDEVISAFDMKREYPNIKLSLQARDALTLFLSEQSRKKYELIMISNHLRAHSNDAYISRSFQVLIEESLSHFKHFGDMMAKMGILFVPRVVMWKQYQTDDPIECLAKIIDENLAIKEEYANIIDIIAKDSQELSGFFAFVSNQHSYHIHLMTKVLKYIERKKNG